MTTCSNVLQGQSCLKTFTTKKKLSDHKSSCSFSNPSLRTCLSCQLVLSTIGSLRKHSAFCKRSPSDPCSSTSAIPPISFTSPSGGNTRIQDGLQMLREDTSLISSLNLHSAVELTESSQKKEAWVTKLIQSWCSNVPGIIAQDPALAHLAGEEGSVLDPYSDATTMRFFLLLLSRVCNYGNGTLEDVVIPVMKRMYLREQGLKLPVAVLQAMATTIREIKRTNQSTSQGKAPALLFDVAKVVSEIPQGRFDKTAEASLFLFAVSVGARACTCEAICLGDIMAVVHVPRERTTMVVLQLRVTKGNKAWDQKVTIEGRLETPSDLDPVYWLNRMLKDRHGLHLSTFNNWELGVEDEAKSMWGWSKDAMREHFKKACVNAGYPRLLLSFHSLRSGFICTALLKANSDGIRDRLAILETTGFVAGWLVGGRAQLRYVKTAAVGCIVASRLVAPGSEQLSNNPVEELLTKPEIFHGIELGPNRWSESEVYRSLGKRLREKVKALAAGSVLSPENLQLFIISVVERSYSAYVKATKALELKARRVYTKNKLWKQPRSKWTAEHWARVGVARAHLEQTVTNSNLEAMTALVFSYVDQGYVDRRLAELSTSKRVRKYPTPDRPRVASGARSRRDWSVEETKIVVDGVAELGKDWVAISKRLTDRSNVDCKDRFRNWERKRQRQE